MFELIPTNTRIPFMKFRYPMFLISSALLILSFYFIFTRGFQFGVDFAGGIELVVALPKDSGSSAEALRKTFEKLGIHDATVQAFGGTFEDREAEFNVHFTGDFTKADQVSERIQKAFSSTAKPQVVRQFRFTGIEKAYLTLSEEASLEEVKKAISSVDFGILKLSDVSPFGRGTSNEYQLSFESVSSLIQKALEQNFVSQSGAKPKIQKVDFVGAKVGKDLKTSAILSMLATILLIFVYIFVRFDLTYAPGVIVSLIHDVGITAGLFSILGLEFDLTIVAALLTLAGYSINDTIIVYDRIREVSTNLRGKAFVEIIDLAANQTLSRTIITSCTVFLATFALWMWGGPVIHGFSTAFLIGVVVGTYSSVFIAAPIILWMDNWMNARAGKTRKAAA